MEPVMSTPDPQQLVPTAGQTIGPFYGFALPYERGHELVPPGTPGAVRLHGTVLDGAGVPVPDAMLEIRQADPSGNVPAVEGSLRRDGTVFTGWGRCAVDPGGRYSFTTVEPGATDQGSAPFFAVTVFARGLLNRLFTRAYLPGSERLGDDRLLAGLGEDRRQTLVATREDDGSLRFDIHLQGEGETVFLAFPRHSR
ncbi:protocatechuate 3,4-dioxygenase alpha subunit [Phycicoccus sp. SLBN-51]|nr:protocatechuate 3,4-dioxygenase alpha subunit [Phycicoccus sp. SLBN-51]